VIDRENDVNRLLSNVMDYFSDIRDPDLFGDLAPEKKRIKDEKIMEKTFKKYL
jgi:hypothetical protein